MERKNKLIMDRKAELGGDTRQQGFQKIDEDLDIIVAGVTELEGDVDRLSSDVNDLKGIDHGSFALKTEIPQVVQGAGIRVEVNGREHKVIADLPDVSDMASGLATPELKRKISDLESQAENLVEDKLDSGDIVAGNNIHVEVTEEGKVRLSSTLGEASSLVSSVAGVNPNEFGDVVLKPGNIGAAAANHSHTLVSLGAAATSHNHDLDYAAKGHELNSEIHLSTPTASDNGKSVVVKSDGSGYELGSVSGIPVGTIIAWGGITPPVGYLECQGQSLNKATYPGLFAAIGYAWGGSGDTFKLPDFYTAGRFLRSRSSTLAVGTTQEDAIRNITGKSFPGAAWVSLATNDTNTSGAFYPVGTNGGYPTTGASSANLSQSLGFDASKVVPTAEENRPKNAVVMYCIKVADEYINPEQVDMAAMHQEIVELKDTMPYPPMFIQGFKIDYVDRTHIRVTSGCCRSEDDGFNIKFTGSEVVTVSGFSGWQCLYVHVIFKNDDTIIFKVNNQRSCALVSGEKAARRIGSLSWEGTAGVCPFISTLNASGGINFAYGAMYPNYSWNGQTTSASYTSTSFPLTIPNFISCKANAYVYVASQVENAWPDIWIRRTENLCMITQADCVWTTGNFKQIFSFDTGTTVDSNKINLNFAAQAGKTFLMQVYTLGYTDWRID